MTNLDVNPEVAVPRGLGPLVILDTNIWIRERLLTSQKAQELVNIVSRVGGLIGVPSIVEREILAAVPREVRRSLESANAAVGFASAILGRRLSLEIPADEVVRSAVKRRIEKELGSVIEQLPHTLELVDAAIERVVERLPPNREGHEQFRDSLILETALAAGVHRNVHLVTDDKQFFVEHGLDKGPAEEIAQKIQSMRSSLSLHGGVFACTKALSPLAPKIGEERAAHLIAKLIRADVQSAASKKLFAAGAHRVGRLDVVPTTQPGTVFVSFVLIYDLEPLPEAAGLARSGAELQAEGDCYYDYHRASVKTWNLDEIRLTWHDADGAPRRAALKYLSASLSASAAVFKDGE